MFRFLIQPSHPKVPSKKFMSLLIIIMFLPMVGIGLIAQNLMAKEISSQIDNQLGESLRLVGFSMERTFAMTEQVYNRIMVDPSFIDVLSTRVDGHIATGEEENLRLITMEENYNAPYLSDIAVLLYDDLLIQRQFMRLTKGTQLIFDDLKRELPPTHSWVGLHPLLDDVLGRSKHQYAASFIGSIRDVASNDIGVIILDLDYDYILSIFEDRFVGHIGTVHLIAPDGRTLTIVSNQSGLSEIIKDESITTDIQSIQSSLSSSSSSYAFKVLRINGQREFVASRQIALTGYQLIARVDYGEAMHSVTLVRIWTGLFMVLSIIMISILAIQYVKTLKTKADLAESEARYRLTAEGANDVLWDWNLSEHKLHLSHRWWQIMSYDREDEEISEVFWEDTIHPHDYGMFLKQIYATDMYRGQDLFIELKMLSAQKEYVWFLLRGKKVLDDSNQVTRIVGTLSDISRRKQQEQLLKNLAYKDTLTNLSNRNGMSIDIEKQLLEIKPGINAGLIFIDLDNFKYINDTYGHDVGDHLLIKASLILKDLAKENWVIARVGGDEFVLFTANIMKKHLEVLAARLIDAFKNPIHIEQITCYISISVGIAIFPDHGRNLKELMKSADIAMYIAKDYGKNQAVLYNPSMMDNMKNRMIMEQDMRDSLKHNDFLVHYQPQISVKTGEITGYEALVRWRHPSGQFISPARFIPLAEESGLIHPLGNFVFHEAIKTLIEIEKHSYNRPHMSINLSVHQLMDDPFIDQLETIVSNYQVSCSQIVLEITESVLIEDFSKAISQLERLASIGFKIALDDFGKGYSSLNYIRQLPIHILKMDKDLIDDILKDDKAEILASFMIKMAEELGLDIVAEGVEALDQYQLLYELHCSLIQGYFFSKPLPASEIIIGLQSGFQERAHEILRQMPH